MASSSTLYPLILILSFISPFLLALEISKRAYLHLHAWRAETDSFLKEAGSFRKGIRSLYPLALFLLQNSRVRAFFERVQKWATSQGYAIETEALCSWYCVILPVVFIAGVLFGGSVLVGFALSIALLLTQNAILGKHEEKREQALREAVPDVLRAMGACSQVGYSLQQSFVQLTSETAEPMKSLFASAVHDLEMGKTTSQALETFRNEIRVSELAFVAVAFEIQHRSGGSLRSVLESARDSVESELELKRNLRVQTAQAKLSARIVSIMPLALITIFSFLSPGFLDPFFESWTGFSLLVLAVLMQLGGIFAVRRLLDVEVG